MFSKSFYPNVTSSIPSCILSLFFKNKLESNLRQARTDCSVAENQYEVFGHLQADKALWHGFFFH